MANPLVSLRNLMVPDQVKTITATVSSIKNINQVVVQLDTGNTMTVWGSVAIGDRVLIKDASIIAVIDKESTQQVFVP